MSARSDVTGEVGGQGSGEVAGEGSDLLTLLSAGPAVVTMELQRGVVGDLTTFPELAAASERAHVVENTARLLAAARSAGVPVVHCVATFREDRVGSPANAPLLRNVAKLSGHLVEGTPASELARALGQEPPDLVSSRRHGVAPFTGTDLDPTLRSLGARTLVVAGVSLNLGIPGLAIEAVDLGYEVVVASDAVAGVPEDYAAALLRHTLALVATLATVAEIAGALENLVTR